jgi:TP901 family phage tail tape measure protein
MSGLLSDLDRFAKANDRVGDKADKAGKRIDTLAKAGGVLGFGLGVAVAKFAEFDAAMSQAQAASGTTGKELGALRDAAVKAGKDTQYSATEAAQGITELSKAGVSASNILKGGLAGALSLAAAGQIEVADAAEIAATAMTQFKLQGSQVSHVADLLAAGANKAQGGVGDLGMALKQSGLVAGQTGLSIEETTAGLTAFASAGLIGSDAGTSFKTMLQRLTPQSDEAAGLMEQLGISAYDAGGNFIGLEKFAGNLQGALKNLTPEQRNAAMSVIFGSDAVRAANVLYNEGAEGIHRWTEETNQAGYAAQQAAQLTDNLKGDLERLGGSFETNLIQAGSGANDTLRFLVQTGESALDVLGQIPGPVMAGAAAFTALALVGPKIGAFAGKVTGSLATIRTELALQQTLARGAASTYDGLGDRIAGAGTKAKLAGAGFRAAGSGLLSALGGGWGIALAGATAAVGLYAQAQADAKARVQALSDTIDQQTGKFTAASKKSVVESLVGDLSGNEVDIVKRLGFNFEQLADSALKGGPAFDANKAKLSDLLHQYERSGGLMSDERAALETLLRAYSRTGDAAGDAAAKYRATADIMKGQQAVQTATTTGLDVFREATRVAGVAAADANPQVDGMAVMMGKLGAKSEDAKTAVDGLKNAIDLLSGGQLALRAAQRQVEESLDGVKGKAKAYTEAVSKHGKKSQEARDADREWRAAIDGVASSTQEELKNLVDTNAKQSDLTKAYNTGRDAIEAQLKKRGLHGKALQEEADKIIGTRDDFALLLAEYAKNPDQVATTIKTPGLGTAKVGVKQYWEVINGVPTVVSTKFNITVTGLPQVRTAVRLLGQLPGFGAFNLGLAGLAGVTSARGNLVRAYAGGGLDAPNGHVAEIATSGVRMWAEPETQGEAYIPLANDWRRPRAKAIASETVNRLGGQVSWYAAGGISSYASGGVRAPLDQFYTDFTSGNTVTRDDLAANRTAVARATEKLRVAEMKLAEDRRKRKSARQIAADELAVARARDAVGAASRKAAADAARYRAQSFSPLSKFGMSLSSGVKNTGAFIANIQKIASRGFVTLAQNLAAMSNEDAEKIAAQAASASDGTLTTLQGRVTTAQTQQAKLDHIDTITAILGQVRSKNLTARQMAAATGIDVMEILDSAALIKADLAKNRNASKLLADLAKRDRGQLFSTGGAVFGAGTETSDSIPAWLSTNEHVWTGREVRGAGGHAAVMRLRKLAAAGQLPGFARGGPVGVTVRGGWGSNELGLLLEAVRSAGGDTFQAYGLNAEAAIQQAMRDKAFRDMGRLVR